MRCVGGIQLAVLCAALVISGAWGQNPFLGASGFGQFGQSGLGGFGSFGDFGAPLPELIDEDVAIVEGTTPANVVIEKIVSYPAEGEEDVVILRNIGGQTADLTGWSVSDSDDPELAFEFGQEGCEDLAFIQPSKRLVLNPISEENECGFKFGIGYRDSLGLYKDNGEMVATVEWDQSEQGTAIRRIPGEGYKIVSENRSILETLKELGQFSTFLKALKAAKLDRALMSENDPEYEGVDESLFAAPEPPPVQPQFPAWFGFEFNRSSLPPPPPPPPPPPVYEGGIPELGPFTLLAPTDAAFDDLRAMLAGPGNDPWSVSEILALPELKDILLYHILAGSWDSDFLRNNTAIVTAKGVEVVPFRDGAMTEGQILLHDSCVDKPTPDPYECEQQVDFNKCHDLFMTSPLGAQWQGGFCQRTCERCTCDGATGTECAVVEDADILARNGIIHVVSRVLFPPPKFKKVVLTPLAEDDSVGLPSLDPITKPDLTIGFGRSDQGSRSRTG